MIALVPRGVVTVTGTEPVPGGASAWMTVPFLFTLRMDAVTPPKLTEVTPPNPVPVILTLVPPVTGPVAGESPVTTVNAVPDQLPLSPIDCTVQVPDTDVPPTTIPLNVSFALDALTFHEPPHEIVPVTTEFSDPENGEVAVMMMEPPTVKGALLLENVKLPDQYPCSPECTDELQVPAHAPAAGRETHPCPTAPEGGVGSGPTVTARALTKATAPPTYMIRIRFTGLGPSAIP